MIKIDMSHKRRKNNPDQIFIEIITYEDEKITYKGIYTIDANTMKRMSDIDAKKLIFDLVIIINNGLNDLNDSSLENKLLVSELLAAGM
jgi:hypothetical protein